jgi:hypothetical protein
MTQSLWFLGARFNIIADATTTESQYDLIEKATSHRASRLLSTATRAIPNKSMC